MNANYVTKAEREKEVKEKKKKTSKNKKKHNQSGRTDTLRKKIWDAMWTQQTITSLKKKGKPINHSEGMA